MPDAVRPNVVKKYLGRCYGLAYAPGIRMGMRAHVRGVDGSFNRSAISLEASPDCSARPLPVSLKWLQIRPGQCQLSTEDNTG